MRRPATEGQPRTAGIWGAKLGVVVTLAAFLLGGCADMPVFHDSAQFVGLATTPKEGQDFIRDTHPNKTEFTSVGVEPAHPPDKPRDPAGVKQLQAELQAQRDAGHAILQTLSPPPSPAPAPAPVAAQKAPADQAKAKPSSNQKEQAAAKPKEKPNAKKKRTEPADDDQAAQ